jgi:DNA polymerase II small subunit/DNA polymerase delta subunit B
MEKLEILKSFLEEGIQLTPKALDLIFENQEIIEKIKKYAREKDLILIDEKVLLELKRMEKQQEVRILYPEEELSFSLQDVLEMLKERFEFLSKIIQENHHISNLTSLHKAKKLKKGEEATVIGMVKDKTTYAIILEDFTGHETIQLDAKIVERLSFDDVVAIKIRKEEETFVGDKIFFPSLTFFRKTTTLEKEVIIHNSEIKVENRTVAMKLDEILRVYIGEYKLFLLNSKIIEAYKQKNERELDTLISLIERRHLNPSFFLCKKFYKKDLFLMDEIPDSIIVFNSKEALYKAYKGINIFFLPPDKKLFLKEKKFG